MTTQWKLKKEIIRLDKMQKIADTKKMDQNNQAYPKQSCMDIVDMYLSHQI